MSLILEKTDKSKETNGFVYVFLVNPRFLTLSPLHSNLRHFMEKLRKENNHQRYATDLM
jgi:hypothetical protein